MEKKIAMDKMKKLEDNQQYIFAMRPVFNRRALFSDTTEEFVSPAEPEAYDKVTIRFRTAKNNVDMVSLVLGDESYIMAKTESDKHFDYYALELSLEDKKITYHFEIQTGRFPYPISVYLLI